MTKETILNMDIISKVITVSPDISIGEAASIMADNAISCVIVEVNGAPAGIITERNIVGFLFNKLPIHTTPVKEIMSSPVITARRDINIYEAYRIIVSNRIRHIVLTDNDGKISGVITQTDILKWLGHELKETRRVSNVMTKGLVSFSSTATLHDVVSAMVKRSISCVIMEEQGKPSGVITERDITRLLNKDIDLNKTLATEVMNRPVLSVYTNTPIHEVLRVMEQNKIRRVVVLDEETSSTVGLVTQSDLIRGVLEGQYIESLVDVIKKSEGKYQTLFENSKDTVYISTEKGEVLDINRTGISLFGYSKEEFLKMGIIPLYKNPSDRDNFIEMIKKNGYVKDYEVDLKNKNGKIIHAIITAITQKSGKEGGLLFQGIIRDITEAKRAEKALIRKNRALGALGECNKKMIHATSEKQLLSDICQIITEVGGFRLAWVGYAINDANKSVQPISHSGFEDGYLDTVKITWNDTDRGPTGTVINTGKPVIIHNIETDPSFKPWRSEAVKRGYSSFAAMPLFGKDKCIGALNIYSSEPDAFDEEEIDLLQDLAGNLSFGLLALRERSERKEAQEKLQNSEKRLKAILDNATAVIFLKDINGRYIFINKRYEELFHVTPKEIEGRTDHDIFPKKMADQFRANDLKVLESNKPMEMEELVPQDDGMHTYISIKFPLLDATDAPYGVCGIATDITERKETQTKLEKSHSLLQATLESTGDGILVVGKDAKIIRYNQAFLKMWKVPEPLAAGKDSWMVADFVLEQLKDPDAFIEKMKELYNKLDITSFDYIGFKDGRTFEQYTQPQRIGEEVVGRVFNFRDITERKQQEDKITFLAFHDPLTALPNRRTFSDRLTQELLHAKRNKTMGAVMFLDLDRFKEINDTMGHDTGDVLLQHVAVRLQRSVREEDTVSRIGGDEFIVIFSKISDKEDSIIVAKKIIETVGEPVKIDGRHILPTISAGISIFPNDGNDPEILIKKADDAMYVVKRAGRNGVRLYSDHG